MASQKNHGETEAGIDEDDQSQISMIQISDEAKESNESYGRRVIGRLEDGRLVISEGNDSSCPTVTIIQASDDEGYVATRQLQNHLPGGTIATVSLIDQIEVDEGVTTMGLVNCESDGIHSEDQRRVTLLPMVVKPYEQIADTTIVLVGQDSAENIDSAAKTKKSTSYSTDQQLNHSKPVKPVEDTAIVLVDQTENEHHNRAEFTPGNLLPKRQTAFTMNRPQDSAKRMQGVQQQTVYNEDTTIVVVDQTISDNSDTTTSFTDERLSPSKSLNQQLDNTKTGNTIDQSNDTTIVLVGHTYAEHGDTAVFTAKQTLAKKSTNIVAVNRQLDNTKARRNTIEQTADTAIVIVRHDDAEIDGSLKRTLAKKSSAFSLVKQTKRVYPESAGIQDRMTVKRLKSNDFLVTDETKEQPPYLVYLNESSISQESDEKDVSNVTLVRMEVPSSQDETEGLEIEVELDEGDETNQLEGAAEIESQTYLTVSGETIEVMAETIQSESEYAEANIQEVGSPKEEEFVIQMPPDFHNSLLKNMQNNFSETYFDLPVFCSDGLAYSSKFLLAAASPFVKDILTSTEPDVCLILPDLTKSTFEKFQSSLMQLTEDDSLDAIRRTAQVLAIDFPFTTSDDNCDETLNTVDYRKIFGNHFERKRLFACMGYLIDENIDQSNNLLAEEIDDQHGTLSSSIETLQQLASITKKNDLSCTKCRRSFVDEMSLGRHVASLHSTKPISTLLRGAKLYECKHCPSTFHYSLNLKKHLWSVHPEDKVDAEEPTEVEHEDQNTSGLVLKATKEVKLKEKYEDMTCKICGFLAQGWKQLQIHIMDHTNERPFKCKTCGKGFKEVQKLERHNICHTGIRAFKCQFCGKAFGLLHNMKTHERMHLGKGFNCDYCGQIYSQQLPLNKHTTIHLKKGHTKTTDINKRNKQRINVAGRGRPSLIKVFEKEGTRLLNQQVEAATEATCLLNQQVEVAAAQNIEDETIGSKTNA